MTHERVMGILAWLFSIFAIVLIVYSACTGSGISLCTLFLTLALLFQTAYSKEMKKGRGKK